MVFDSGLTLRSISNSNVSSSGEYKRKSATGVSHFVIPSAVEGAIRTVLGSVTLSHASPDQRSRSAFGVVVSFMVIVEVSVMFILVICVTVWAVINGNNAIMPNAKITIKTLDVAFMSATPYA